MRISLNANAPLIKGFTLLEVLLVMVVMSVMASLLVFSISDNPHQLLDRETRRLQAVINLAIDEAVTKELEIALMKSKDIKTGTNGYQFSYLDLDDNLWQKFSAKPLGHYSLPDSISFVVELDEGRSRRNSTFDVLGSQGGAEKPLLVIFSNGEISPFKLVVKHSAIDQPVSLASDGFSEIEKYDNAY